MRIVFVKHNSLKSDIFLILYLFQVFQGSGFSESRFFRFQVFQGPGPGSGSRVRVQVLEVALDYLTFRKQRTKVCSAYSKWARIKQGIPQGSILGLNLFNIFINDIFMIIEQSAICNFADNDTLWTWQEWLTEVKENLIFYTKVILYWFIPFSPVLCRSL